MGRKVLFLNILIQIRAFRTIQFNLFIKTSMVLCGSVPKEALINMMAEILLSIITIPMIQFQ